MLYRYFDNNPRECPHCNNTGLVDMDVKDGYSNTLDPCPMCRLGEAKSKMFSNSTINQVQARIMSDGSIKRLGIPSEDNINRDGKLIGKDNHDYYAFIDLTNASWNRGLNFSHKFYCKTNGCNSQPVDRKNKLCSLCQSIVDLQKKRYE